MFLPPFINIMLMSAFNSGRNCHVWDAVSLFATLYCSTGSQILVLVYAIDWFLLCLILCILTYSAWLPVMLYENRWPQLSIMLNIERIEHCSHINGQSSIVRGPLRVIWWTRGTVCSKYLAIFKVLFYNNNHFLKFSFRYLCTFI